MVFTILSELTYPTQTRTLLNPEIFQNFWVWETSTKHKNTLSWIGEYPFTPEKIEDFIYQNNFIGLNYSL